MVLESQLRIVLLKLGLLFRSRRLRKYQTRSLMRFQKRIMNLFRFGSNLQPTLLYVGNEQCVVVRMCVACQEPTLLTILKFIFQSNSPLFPHSSLFSHDHSSSKQDKQFIWRHKYMVISSVAVVLVSTSTPSPFNTRPALRSPPTLRQASSPPPGSQRFPHLRVLPSQTTGESIR